MQPMEDKSCGRGGWVVLGGCASLVFLILALPVMEAIEVAVAIQKPAIFLPAVGCVLDEAVGSVLGGLPIELAVGFAVGGSLGGRAVGSETPGGTLEPLGKVGVLVEVPEKEPEHDGVEANPPHEATWVVAVGSEQQLE